MIIKNKLHNLIKKYPIVSSIVIVLGFIVVLKIIKFLLQLCLDGDVLDLCLELVGIALPLVMVFIFGYDYIFRIGDFFKTLKIGMFWIVMQIIALGSVILLRAIEGKLFNWKGPMGIILFVVQLFGIGFREELLFRGIVGNAIGRKYGRDNKGVWFSTIMVALMFGLMNMTNVFAGVKLSSVVIQSIVAVGAGMMLNAVYYRGGSIWALIFIHSLVDFVGLFSTLFEDSVSEIEVINSIELQNLAPFFLCTIVTIILLRKSKIGEAVEFLSQKCP